MTAHGQAQVAGNEAGPWGRTRLLVILAGAVALVLTLAVGLASAVRRALGDDAAASGTTTAQSPVRQEDATPGQSRGSAYRDEIAASPMPSVSAKDARSGGPPAMTPASSMTVPAGTRTGPGRVPTGFPHTPEGAVGQLAALEGRVLEAMDLRLTKQVRAAWSLPGGPSADEWEMAANVRAFLGALGSAETLDEGTTVSVTPAAGIVKGTDGPDWVLACALVTVTATTTRTAAMGYGHCERMQWSNGRWMIAAGPQPAPAPSTWPGTAVAALVGWRTWITAPGARP